MFQLLKCLIWTPCYSADRLPKMGPLHKANIANPSYHLVVPSKVVLHEVSDGLWWLWVFKSILIPFQSVVPPTEQSSAPLLRQDRLKRKWQHLAIGKCSTNWVSHHSFSTTSNQTLLPKQRLGTELWVLNSYLEVTFMYTKTQTMHKSSWNGVCSLNVCCIKIQKLRQMRITCWLKCMILSD